MQRSSRLAAWTTLAITAILAGCGTRAQHPKPLSAWLSYDSVQRTATITVVPAYDNAYGGFNFNGYAKGQVAVIVPVGLRVAVRCANTGQGGRHSCAIVRGAGATRPAFLRASSPHPVSGLAPGRTASFSFLTRALGVYRIASLVPNDERAGMWDVLEIKRVRLPTVTLLRRPP
jgi:Sulfocyanin (SoxE) domain